MLAFDGLAGNDQMLTSPASAPLLEQVDGGDGADTTTVQGTDGADTLAIAAAAPRVAVSGGAAGTVAVDRPRAMFVNGLAGNDTINAGTGLARLDGAHDRRRRRQRHDQRRRRQRPHRRR